MPLIGINSYDLDANGLAVGKPEGIMDSGFGLTLSVQGGRERLGMSKSSWRR